MPTSSGEGRTPGRPVSPEGQGTAPVVPKPPPGRQRSAGDLAAGDGQLAWTDPDELAAWYSAEHLDTPRETIHIDLRVGGHHELTMVQRGSGAEFPVGYEILELVEPEQIVLRSDPMPEMGMHEPTLTRVEFHDHGAKTRMTLVDGPYPRPAAATPRPAGTPPSPSSLRSSPGRVPAARLRASYRRAPRARTPRGLVPPIKRMQAAS